MKSFAKVRAVDGVDLTIGAGERVAPARPQRRRQDHHPADAARRHHARRGHDRPRGPRPARGAARRPCTRSASSPATCPCPSACGSARRCRCSPGSTGSRRKAGDAAVDGRARALRVSHLGRPHVHGAVVGPAHARRHREGGPPPALAARARRAHRQPRPRRRLPRPRRPARRRRQRRHRAARHQPQHARGRAALRAGRVPRRRPGRRRRLARRGGRARSATATSRACSSTWPARSSPRTRSPSLGPRPERRCVDDRRRSPPTEPAPSFSWLRVRTVVRRLGYVLWPQPAPLVRRSSCSRSRRAPVRLARRVRRAGERRHARRHAVPAGRDHALPRPLPEPSRRWPPASWRRRGAATSST